MNVQCPTCDEFAFTQVELAEHSCRRYRVVPNGLGGRTTVRVSPVSTTTVVNGVRPATPAMIRYLHVLVKQKAPGTDPAFTAKVIAQGFDRVDVAIKRLKGK